LRGLSLIYHVLQNMQTDASVELHFTSVSVAICSIPRCLDFYKGLAQGRSKEKLDMELARWLVGLNAIVNRIRRFLAHGGYGQV
ncbi:hypothetical protein J132_06847, partial [Termitomyces sp. J132]